MDLRTLMSTVAGRWKTVLAATLLGLLVAVGANQFTTPRYAASAQLYVSSLAGGGAQAAYQEALASQQRVQSYARLAASRSVAQEVVDRTGVDLTADEVVGRIRAAGDAKTVLLTITVTDTDPRRAAELADAVGNVLGDVVRRLETPAAGGAPLATLTVVSVPQVPTTSVEPRVYRNLALGGGVGLMAGIGLALLTARMDRSIRSAEQAEEVGGRPVVGSIPFRRKQGEDGGTRSHLVSFRAGHSPAAEAFRRLRTNLRFLDVDNPPRVIVVTSSVAKEGKSESAVNLAAALAEGGHSVVLVEADLRRPRVASSLGLSESVGLTTVLAGHAELDDVLQEDAECAMYVLAAGALPPNPAELLESATARRIITELRDRFDFVIIDSPPLLPVTDAALLAKNSDGALLVIRANATPADHVRASVGSLDQVGARLLGLVLVESKDRRKWNAEGYTSYSSAYAPTAAPATQAEARPAVAPADPAPRTPRGPVAASPSTDSEGARTVEGSPGVGS